MAEPLLPPGAWSTQGDDPSNPFPDSTFPTITMAHVLSYNVVPVDIPARLDDHNTPLSHILAQTTMTTYSLEHISYKSHGEEQTKSFTPLSGPISERKLYTEAATAFGIKSARYRSIYRTLKTPSNARKALAMWNKQGKEGLAPQQMTFSATEGRQVEGKPHFCITCTVDEAYPNFHIQCILQYLNHTETLDGDVKIVRLAVAVIQTNENSWILALEQRGTNDSSTKQLLGETEYNRLESIKIGRAEKGLPKGSPTHIHAAKKIVVPNGYDLGKAWCQPDGFYQVTLNIPESMPGLGI